MFLGLLGFVAVVLALCLLLLSTWRPGGVRHARRGTADAKGKEHAAAEIDLVRTRIDVRAEDVRLTHVRRVVRARRGTRTVETPILAGVSALFPSGEVSAIMGPSGCVSLRLSRHGVFRGLTAQCDAPPAPASRRSCACARGAR
jgi:hypothetical protein